MMNGDRVAYQIDAQPAACLKVKVENVVYGKIEPPVSSHANWLRGQSWPWGQIRSVEQAVREQAWDNWEMIDGKAGNDKR